jgi:hypothetical protein
MARHSIGVPASALVVASALMGISYSADLAMVPPPPPLTAPFSSPSPAPDPAFALELALFRGIADRDPEAVRLALNAGADPNGSLPAPAPEEIRRRFPNGPLEFYFRREKGFTPLMFAAALGNELAVRYLLMAGADRHQCSRSSGTFALWQAARNGHIGVMKQLMDITPESECSRYRVHIDLATQRATIWKDGIVFHATEISSGRPSTPTPPGRYLVTNKYRQWKSTIYPARMPFFLRLSCGDFGLHAGVVPGYPASHGCVRLPPAEAEKFFALLPVGTEVEIR